MTATDKASKMMEFTLQSRSTQDHDKEFVTS